jgi:hypothetical protein
MPKEAKAAEARAKPTQGGVPDVNIDAAERTAEARENAAEAKREADYRVALERCDSLTGDLKDACVGEAKARFGKS